MAAETRRLSRRGDPMTAHSASPDLREALAAILAEYDASVKRTEELNARLNRGETVTVETSGPYKPPFMEQVRAALQASPAPEPRKGYVLDYDAENRWLVMSDPEGVSGIIARDVRATDAPYLIAGYNGLAAPPSEALDTDRLARALEVVGWHPDVAANVARLAAAEYARLQSKEPTP